jgi:cholesterol transport system auxiliary component
MSSLGPRLGRRRALALLAAGSALALSGCQTALQLATRQPPRLFQLTPKSTFPDDLPTVASRLQVEVPTATAGLNTARIALRPTPTTLDYYAGGNWIDVVPVMTQNLLIESFDNADRVDVLGREVVGVRADHALLTHIREFQAEYFQDGPPAIRVRFQARLVQLPRRTSLASTSFQEVVSARDGSLEGIVQAFDEAFGRVTKRLVEWTLRELESVAAGTQT